MGYDLPDEVTVRSDGPVRIVTLNRPDALNAVNEAMHTALVDVWGQLEADRDAGAVVLTGAGRAFCAGGDMGFIRATSEDPDRARASTDEAARLMRAMLEFPLPVVAAVNGPAVGLGCSLTVLADLVLISDDAHLADPHVPVGLVAGDGGLLLPFLSSMHLAKEFLFLGGRLSSEEAVRAGLANRRVPGDELAGEAIALAGRLAAMPAPALRDTKRALNSLMLAAWPTLAMGVTAERASMASPEHRAKVDDLGRE